MPDSIIYVFDSDTTSNITDEARTSKALRERARREPADNICVTIVTVQEIFRGSMAVVDKVSGQDDSQRTIRAYFNLLRAYTNLQRFVVLPYDEAADSVFQQIPVNVRQKRKRDCRIAAIAMSRGYTVVTSNTRDFSLIPDLQYEDWSLSIEDVSE